MNRRALASAAAGRNRGSTKRHHAATGVRAPVAIERGARRSTEPQHRRTAQSPAHRQGASRVIHPRPFQNQEQL